MEELQANTFTLKSNELIHNQTLPITQIYNGYGCSGKNISPELSWTMAPTNTKSYAIVCHDPDAPKENGWYHWLVLNIPSNINSIKQGEKIPNTLETNTDFGTPGFNGACPPKGHGIHHYNYTVYALNTEKIDISKDTNPHEVHKKIMSYAIAKSTITGLFERK